jgi:predicted HTH domain antitoxin
MSVSTIPLNLPAGLQEQVTAAREAGLNASETELVTDAIRTLLAARPDLRAATACQLYAQGRVSLGKGAELAGLDVDSFKRSLHERGVSRVAPESAADTSAMSGAALGAAGSRE